LRFVLAIVSFVLAFVLIGYGVAQRTIFAGPDNVTAVASLSSDAPVTVIDSSVLRKNPGHQTITVSGTGKVFAAYGRTDDVKAWVGDASYNKIGYNAEKVALTDKVVDGKESTVPDPHGSDLWLDERSGEFGLSFTINVPKGISVIIASDGKNAAPSTVSIRWPLDNRTPWSGPLVIAGVLLLLLGLGLYLWALNHLRKARGPRRKSPKMPKVPRQRRYKPNRSKPPEVASGRRRSTKRRFIAVVPVLLVGALALSGCSADIWPTFGGGQAEPTPTATAAPDATSNQQHVAVTVPQLREILSRVSAASVKADEAKDPGLLASRFEGPALELRTANYAIRKIDNTVAALPAIPSGKIEVALPQQRDTWPRTVFTVVSNPADKTASPIALMLVQESPRENYKVGYALTLEPKVVLPEVAGATVGAPQISPDNKLFVLAPSKIVSAYGDILLKGPGSEFAKYFDTTADQFVAKTGFDAKQAQKAAIPDKASIEFSNEPGVGETIVFGTNDSGAIVVVNLNQIETVTPTEAGASVNPSGLTKTLSGITSTLKGVIARYSDQLMFYVPKIDSNEKIVLLGSADGLISAKEKP
jgi:hypothetical protein